MAARDDLVAVWNTTGLPANTTGAGLVAGDQAQQKIDKINTWMKLTGVSIRAILEPSAVLNAIAPADLAALLDSSTNALFQANSLKLQMLNLLLSGVSIDASSGTIRTTFQTIFAGKATTLSQLGTLVSPYDNPRQEWWRSVGFQSPITLGDAIAAGL